MDLEVRTCQSEDTLDVGKRGHLGHLVGRIGVYLEEGENSRSRPIRRSGCRRFQAVKGAGEVPGGLDVSMCLVVEKASIASVADNEPLPFVVAVDVNRDPTDENHEEGYEGHFKLAISSLLPDLYPPLASRGLSSDELWPFAKPIFKDAYGLEE